jgi:hypothetical protein
MTTPDLRQADIDSRHAAMSLSAALPCDIVLYLLLPMYADQFHVSLAEAGVLLAANRLVRIAGYRWVASFLRPTRRPSHLPLAVLAGHPLRPGLYGGQRLLGLVALAAVVGHGLCRAEPVDPGHVDRQSAGRSARSAFARRDRHRADAVAAAGGIAGRAPGTAPVFLLVAMTALLGLLAARRLPAHALPPPWRAAGSCPMRWTGGPSWRADAGWPLHRRPGLHEQAILRADGELVAGILMALRYAGEIVSALGRLAGRALRRGQGAGDAVAGDLPALVGSVVACCGSSPASS